MFRLFFSLSFILFFSTAFFQTDAWSQEGSGFETIAPNAVILDYETGIVLYEKDARRAIPPASMTKIMTAEMVFDRLKSGALSPDTKFKVSQDAWMRGGEKSGSSTMFLKPGSEVGVEDLLRGVIIQSGNDACIVLAEGLAGSERAFADLMTLKAREMGLDSASFKNATGWPDPDHKISVYDLARLARTTIAKFPEYYPIYAETSYTWNGIRQGNRNPLLGRFPGADGLKTGHTQEAGYGLVGSAKRADTRRIIVLAGLDSKAERRAESERVMQAAFDQFKIYSLYQPAAVVAPISVYMGKDDTVNAVSDTHIRVGMFRGARPDMTVSVRARKTVPAPIKQGDQIAELVVTAPGIVEQTFPLYAEKDVRLKSAWSRAMAALTNIIRGS